MIREERKQCALRIAVRNTATIFGALFLILSRSFLHYFSGVQLLDQPPAASNVTFNWYARCTGPVRSAASRNQANARCTIAARKRTSTGLLAGLSILLYGACSEKRSPSIDCFPFDCFQATVSRYDTVASAARNQATNEILSHTSH